MKVIKACLVFSILFLLFTVKASAAGLDEIHYIGAHPINSGERKYYA